MKNRRIADYEKQLAIKNKRKTSERDLRFQLFSEFGPNVGKDITDLYNELTLKRGWQEEDEGPKYLTWKRIFARMTNRWRLEKKIGSNIQPMEKPLENLKVYFMERANRRIARQYASKNMEKLFGMLGAVSKGKVKKQADMKKQKKANADSVIQAQIDSGDLQNIPKYVLYPNADFRQRWDITIIMLVLYNVMVIPMEIGLEMTTNTAWTVFDYLVDLLFAIDIALNFRTGYFDERNTLVMDTRRIA